MQSHGCSGPGDPTSLGDAGPTLCESWTDPEQIGSTQNGSCHGSRSAVRAAPTSTLSRSFISFHLVPCSSDGVPWTFSPFRIYDGASKLNWSTKRHIWDAWVSRRWKHVLSGTLYGARTRSPTCHPISYIEPRCPKIKNSTGMHGRSSSRTLKFFDMIAAIQHFSSCAPSQMRS